jgi:hypothetical protein
MALTKLGVTVDRIEDLPPAGASLPGSIRERLLKSDFMCGVLWTQNAASTNVVLELGVGIGLGTPIFIVTDSTASMPLSLTAFPHVKSDLKDSGAIEFHLAAFLQNIESSTRAALAWPKRSRRPTKGAVAIAKLREIEKEPIITEYQLAEVVALAFKAAGAEVAVEPQLEDGYRPDMVVWPAEGSPELGSPILVEIKRRLPSAREARENAQQLQRYMGSLGARTSILVSVEPSPEIQVHPVAGGYVFFVSLSRLIDGAEARTLTRSLIEARNRFVHSSR